MKLFITGGTGLIGSHLIELLLTQKHEITVLSRNAQKVEQLFGAKVDCCQSLSALTSFNSYDAVINLAGEPIADKRWTEEQKTRLIQSRCQITQELSKLILASSNPPSVFISGSAVGYYGSQDAKRITEESEAHDEFTHQLCHQWENCALQAASERTRVCLSRTGIVLASEGGALQKMLPPFRLGIGAILGSGKQYFSWIHIDDMVAALYFLLITPRAQGAFNMTAPNPVTNREFSKTLSSVLHRPCLFFIPSFVLSLAMGESSTVLLDGQRVVPQKLEQLDYQFQFPLIREALEDILPKK